MSGLWVLEIFLTKQFLIFKAQGFKKIRKKAVINDNLLWKNIYIDKNISLGMLGPGIKPISCPVALIYYSCLLFGSFHVEISKHFANEDLNCYSYFIQEWLRERNDCTVGPPETWN